MKKYALSLTSAFSTTSLLKARVKMLYRKPSATFALAKFGFALPALVLCVLFTAFTQRERILPASFVQEAEQVAQRFMGEVQKAFLPTHTQEALPAMSEDVPAITVSGQTGFEVLPSRELNMNYNATSFAPEYISFSTPIPTDTTKPSKAQKLKGDFTFLKSYNLESLYWGKKDKIRFSYIFTKNNYYTIQFVDCVKKEPILLHAKVSVTSHDGEKVEVEELGNGIGFRIKDTGMYHLEYERGTSQESHLAILSFSRGKFPVLTYINNAPDAIDVKPYLTDPNGNIQNLRRKVSLAKPLKVIIPPADGSSFEVERMTFAVFRGGKCIEQNRLYDYKLDLTHLKIKRGDGVQISLDEVVRKNTDGTTTKVVLKEKYLSFFAK